jgi:glutathione S-transferase
MLTIYGVYRSRATRNLWLAGELGIPFKHVPVTQPYRPHGAALHSRSPEFLKINPNGHVPAIDDDGLVLFESLAINLYLAKKHGGPLAPKTIAEDGQMMQWSFWALYEVEGKALEVMRDPKGATAAIEALKAPFAALDAALAKGGGHLVGGRFTVADINVAECVRYAQSATALFDAAPHVKAWLAACQARPAFKAMWAARDKEPA